MNNELMQKLVVAKKIMDVHNGTPRGSARNISMPELQNYDAPPANYNIPQEYLSEVQQPVAQTQNQLPTRDKILN